MSENQFKKILDGNYDNIPVICIVKDYERLCLSKECDMTWKLVDGLHNENVRVLTNRQANDIINDLGLVPTLELRGYGKIYDTPTKEFYNKYMGQKKNVYITN